MKTKLVNLSLSNYQIEKLIAVSGETNMRDAIVYFIENKIALTPFRDSTPRSNIVVRLPLSIACELANGYKSASKGLMARMGVVIACKKHIGIRLLKITDGQFELLSSLGNGDVNEGLKVLIGE